jgi:hypothetical protein
MFNGSLKISYRTPSELSVDEKATIWSLFQGAAFATREAYEASVAGMDEIFLVRKRGAIVGFGGIKFIEVTYKARKHLLIYTGRVFFEPSVRGRMVAPRAGIRTFFKQLLKNPFRPCYWFFASGTLSSYLVMAKNFKSCWPYPDKKWPEKEEFLRDAGIQVIDPIGQPDPETGTYPVPDGIIYKSVPKRLHATPQTDALIAYYAGLNPRTDFGDGVFCLAPLSLRNWISVFSYAIPSAIKAGLRRPAKPVRGNAVNVDF